jgi:hypothetical protein
MALQNPGFWLVDERSVKCVSGPWSVFSRIRTGFPYVNLTGSNLKRFYTFIRSLCEGKVSLDHFLRIRSLENINKYLYQHKFHRKSQENKPFELLLATVSLGGKIFWFVYLFQKINKDEFNVFLIPYSKQISYKLGL